MVMVGKLDNASQIFRKWQLFDYFINIAHFSELFELCIYAQEKFFRIVFTLILFPVNDVEASLSNFLGIIMNHVTISQENFKGNSNVMTSKTTKSNDVTATLIYKWSNFYSHHYQETVFVKSSFPLNLSSPFSPPRTQFKLLVREGAVIQPPY